MSVRGFCVRPMILPARFTTRVNLALSLTLRLPNQVTILKVRILSTSDLYTISSISCLTSKYLSFLSKYSLWLAFLHTESTWQLNDNFLSITVPKYLNESTCSTAWFLTCNGCRRDGSLTRCSSRQSSFVFWTLSSRKLLSNQLVLLL